ncbi:MAG: hypothetical protein AB7F96_05465 [Beijerinckiaceae bacterium]
MQDIVRPGAEPESLIAFIRENPYAEAMDQIASMPESARARLAFFCYQRRHLHGVGLDIAKTCSRGALAEAAGVAGETLYRQSRNPSETMGAGQFTDERAARTKKISLAGGR